MNLPVDTMIERRSRGRGQPLGRLPRGLHATDATRTLNLTRGIKTIAYCCKVPRGAYMACGFRTLEQKAASGPPWVKTV